MLLSYHFYFLNLDNAFLKFWLTDLCVVDHKFIFFELQLLAAWKIIFGKSQGQACLPQGNLDFFKHKDAEKKESKLAFPRHVPANGSPMQWGGGVKKK